MYTEIRVRCLLLISSDNVLSVGSFLIKGVSNGENSTISSGSDVYSLCNATGFFSRTKQTEMFFL